MLLMYRCTGDQRYDLTTSCQARYEGIDQKFQATWRSGRSGGQPGLASLGIRHTQNFDCRRQFSPRHFLVLSIRISVWTFGQQIRRIYLRRDQDILTLITMLAYYVATIRQLFPGRDIDARRDSHLSNQRISSSSIVVERIGY